MADKRSLLPLCPNRLDRLVQLTLRFMQMMLRLRAMSGHIIVVGFAGVVEFVDRFLHVVMDRVQIVPIMHSIGDGDSGNKRQTHRKNSNDNRLIHNFSLQFWTMVVDCWFPGTPEYPSFSPAPNRLSKGNEG